MRLLIFSPYLAPHVGGVEAFVAELNEALLALPGIERITVLAPRLPITAALEERPDERCRVMRYPAVEPIPNFPVPAVWRAQFWRALAAAHPREHDVLMSHTRFFVSSALALVCARTIRRPLLHIEHGSDFVQLGHRLTRTLARLYDHSIGRLVLRRADAVVAISQAAADFVQRLAKRRAVVVYRGMDERRVSVVKPSASVREAANGRVVVTYVGRLIDGKGVADLMRAFATLDADAALLCLVGDGPRRQDLMQLAQQLGIRDRVRFLGYLSETEAIAAMLAADLVVNPSYTEGLPTAVLEAAFLGRAVLATDVGGTREVICDGQSGVLVPARRPHELGLALARLVEQPELRARLGAAAREAALARFDWEASARRLLELAGELIAQSKRYQST